MKWFVTYENNDKRIFSQKTDTREAACEIAFDRLKELTENYRKQDTQYKWTDKGNEICVETDTDIHRFSVCSADEYYVPVALIAIAAVSVVCWMVFLAIFWQETKKWIISYLLILAVPVIFYILHKLYNTDSLKGIEREAVTIKQAIMTAALWGALLVLVAKFVW